jgi:hypothetical protein
VICLLENVSFIVRTLTDHMLSCNVKAEKCTGISQCLVNSSSGWHSTIRKTSLVFSYGMNYITVTGIQLRHELHYRHWYSATALTALPSLVFSYGMNYITVTGIQLRHELHYRHWYPATT